MKITSTSVRQLLLMLLLCFACYGANAQAALTITGQTGNNQPVCPGKQYVYTANISSSQGCGYSWTVVGGTTVGNANSSIITVVWNDVPTNSSNPASIQATTSNCTTLASTQSTGPQNVFVLSLSQTTIGPLSASGDLTFGNNANGSITLSIPQVNVPSPPGTNTIPASAYEWTIPAGWVFPGGFVSTGAPRVVNGTGANSITVTPPAAGTSFTATVSAVDNQCAGGGIISSRSQPVTRTLPTLRVTSNGAPATIRCGDVRGYGFRAEGLGVQPGG